MIETERLILRPPVDGDRASVAAIGADPEVGRWLGGVRDRAASDLLVDRCLEHLERFGFGIGVIERKADRRVIGMAGLGYVPDGLPEEGEVEIGWRLLSEVWGRATRPRPPAPGWPKGSKRSARPRSSPSRRGSMSLRKRSCAVSAWSRRRIAISTIRWWPRAIRCGRT